MKAVLIVEMPECCEKCKLADEGIVVEKYCKAYDLGIPDIVKGKVEWCPLCVLPEKKPEKSMGKWNDFNCGWNACLENLKNLGD